MGRLKDPHTRQDIDHALQALDELLDPPTLDVPGPVARTEQAGLVADPELSLRGTQLIGPAWTWLAGVFVLIYVVAELLLAGIAPASRAFSTLLADALTFVVVGGLLGALIAIARPVVTVRRGGALASPGPWVAASLGGLIVWGVTHNTVPWLVPFADMDGVEAIGFLGVNIVEHTLIGMMLASFTSRPAVAFALGGGFAAAVLAVWTWLVVVM